MGAVGLIARREIRRRWRGVLALTVLVAVVGATVLATTAGARRTRDALDRFREASLSADLELAGSPPTDDQLKALRQIDGVVAVTVLNAPGVQIPDAPQLQSIGVVVDDQFGVVIDRERIVAGRAPDPNAADEIAIGEGLADALHLGVGDQLAALTYTPDQVATILGGASDAGDFAGPNIRFRIVGISRRPLDLGLRGTSGGLLVLTPAFDRVYSGDVGQFGARIRIRTDHRAAAGVDAIEVRVRDVLGDSLFSMQSLAVETQGASDAIDVLALALLVFASVAAIAGAAAIAFVSMREIALASRDQPTLRALGLTRGQRVLASVSVALVAAGVGTVLAVAGAVLASPIFPFGVARRADPDVGLHADWAVIGVGTIASVMVIAVIAVIAAFRSSSKAINGPEAANPRARTSRLADAVSGVGLPPTLAYGLRMAFVRGRSPTTTPVRAASAAAVVGMVAASGVLVFASSLGHLASTPRLYGWTWDFNTLDITSNTPCRDEDFGLSNVPGVASVTALCYQNVLIEGRPVVALSFTPLRGEPLKPLVIEGRAPQFPDEIAAGATTLRAIGRDIGESVTVQGPNASHDYRIVGRVVLPTLGQPQPLSDGIALTGEGFLPIYDQNLFSRYLAGDFSVGASAREAEQRIAAIPQLADPTGPTVPGEIDRLDQINWFPAALAILIGALSLYAVGHALVTSVRRRRAELAILKTLGFSDRQVRATIAWQATALAAVGVLFGIPLGMFVGVQIWRRVAASLGVVLTPQIPVFSLLALVPIALLLANAVAFLPARAAARTRPSVALRSE